MNSMPLMTFSVDSAHLWSHRGGRLSRRRQLAGHRVKCLCSRRIDGEVVPASVAGEAEGVVDWS